MVSQDDPKTHRKFPALLFLCVASFALACWADCSIECGGGTKQCTIKGCKGESKCECYLAKEGPYVLLKKLGSPRWLTALSLDLSIRNSYLICINGNILDCVLNKLRRASVLLALLLATTKSSDSLVKFRVPLESTPHVHTESVARAQTTITGSPTACVSTTPEPFRHVFRKNLKARFILCLLHITSKNTDCGRLSALASTLIFCGRDAKDEPHIGRRLFSKLL